MQVEYNTVFSIVGTGETVSPVATATDDVSLQEKIAAAKWLPQQMARSNWAPSPFRFAMSPEKLFPEVLPSPNCLNVTVLGYALKTELMLPQKHFSAPQPVAQTNAWHNGDADRLHIRFAYRCIIFFVLTKDIFDKSKIS